MILVRIQTKYYWKYLENSTKYWYSGLLGFMMTRPPPWGILWGADSNISLEKRWLKWRLHQSDSKGVYLPLIALICVIITLHTLRNYFPRMRLPGITELALRFQEVTPSHTSFLTNNESPSHVKLWRYIRKPATANLVPGDYYCRNATMGKSI